MSTTNDHELWEELAAGHALSALEPAEEAEFVAHLEQCDRCQEVLADHAFVAAQLGTLVDSEGDAPSWDKIRPAVIPASEPVAEVVDLASRRRRTPAVLGAAAAAVLAIAGTAVVLSSGSGPSTQQEALDACTASSTCHVVRLADAATLVVDSNGARMLPKHMTAAPAGKVYVLWQLPRDGRPTMVATLTDTANGGVGEPHRLPLAYAQTAAFGVSLEPANAVPTAPTKVLVVGTA
jgi:anti-sigma-K factor RskA